MNRQGRPNRSGSGGGSSNMRSHMSRFGAKSSSFANFRKNQRGAPTFRRRSLGDTWTTEQEGSSQTCGHNFQWLSSEKNEDYLSFETMAKQGKFNSIMSTLKAQQADQSTLKTWLNENCSEKETALHLLARHRPTPELVDLLAHTLKRLSNKGGVRKRGRQALRQAVYIPEDALDDFGRTPLHIAAASGCRIDVIDRLLEGETLIMPAITRDDSGRFPLHWACANPTGSTNPILPGTNSSLPPLASVSEAATTAEANRGQVNNMILVIRMLVTAYPEAAGIPDENGLTPFDLALHHQADPAIQSILQSAINFCRKDKTEETAASTVIDVPQQVLHDFSETIFEDCSDDMSSIDWEEDHLLRTIIPVDLPEFNCEIIVGPEDKETEDVVQKCWFI